MAYSKRPNGNLFHNIKGSQSSQAPTQPEIGGMGEVESPAKNILLKLAQKGVTRLLSKGGNKVKFLPKPKVPVANPGIVGGTKTSFGSKVGNFLKESVKYTIGGGVANLLLGSSDDEGAKGPDVENKKKPGSYVKPGGKATGNMKDYALNSQARRDEYTARGWKQDDTTSVKGGNKVGSEIKNKPVVKADVTPDADPITVTPPASTTKPTAVQTQKAKNTMDRKNRSIDKKQAKIDAATESGNDKKARRKQRSLDNKKARLSDKGMLDQKYMSNLSGAEKPKEESPVPYTSRIQASAQYRRPNAAGQYDK